MCREIITLLTVVLMVAMLIGGALMVFDVSCDPHAQRCLEHQQGPLQPGERFT